MAKGRVFNIMQYKNHPITGEELITEQKIIEALNKYKTIKEWAYILHDEDVWSESDEQKSSAFNAVAGDKKPPHFHIVVNTVNNYIDVNILANWFDIPANFIDIPKGRGAFLDCVAYLTHEDKKQQSLGKHLYPDDKVNANFDFRQRLTERADKKLKYGADLSLKNQVRYEVMYNGMTLLQARAFDELNYLDDYKELYRLRLEWLNRQTPPETRMNFYIEGRGGIGKGLLSRALGRQLAKTVNPDLTEDDEMIFEIGAGNSTFEGYDGQPVIIWNDKRAYELLSMLGGRGNLFTVFDTHPTKVRQNVKYSSVNLCNTFNIVNSVESYLGFLNGLAGEYKDKSGQVHHVEDKGQAYRRFPIIIPINENYFTLLGNKGFFEQTPEFEQFNNYGSFVGNFQKVAESFGNKHDKLDEVHSKMLAPTIEKTKEGLSLAENKESLSDDAEFILKHYGKPIDPSYFRMKETLEDLGLQVGMPFENENVDNTQKNE